MTKKYSMGSLVWAKVEGYPWWPGTIKSMSDNIYEILFFGDFSRSFLKSNRIKCFEDSSLKHLITKPKIKFAID